LNPEIFQMKKYAIAIHGGAGTILRSLMSPEKEAEYKEALMEALNAGNEVLEKGGQALDAVEAAIVALEDLPLFNAGRGSVFTHAGKHEMDAALMDGKNLKAGAVAGVNNIKNPIKLARAVMDHSENVLLTGEGAIDFAARMHLPFEKDAYFYTQHRMDQLLAIKDTDIMQMDHTEEGNEKKFGTVGAVALDKLGNLAAGTSTGGMTNKRYGRIGDTPIIGAGTYANNKTCAISCTGHGEFFIRAVVAYDISCLMEYKGLSLVEACNEVVHRKLVDIGGEGGLIAVDAFGNVSTPFNSEGMYRGMKREGEDFLVEIYK
jgi:beta-aspartyl-peptidase (threonine type)